MYTFPNYGFVYLISSKSNRFNFKDDVVQAIFSMLRKNKISIIGNFKLKNYVRQYILKKIIKFVLIAKKKYKEENCYL